MLSSRYLPSISKQEHLIVLLHAFPLSGAMWLEMASQLSSLRDDTAILIFDMPGFGDSAVRESWTMPELSLELRSAIEQHSRAKVTIAGLSMGGYQALEFYRANPGRVRALVLSNTKAEADTEEEKQGRHTFAEDALKRGADAAIDRLYSKFVVLNTDPDIAVQIRSWISEADPRAIAAALIAMANRNDSRDLLPLVTVPSLVIASSDDVIAKPEVMRAMAARLEDSTFLEIKDTAHLSAVERPQEWAEALASFLARV